MEEQIFKTISASLGGSGPALARLVIEKKKVKEARESEVCFWFLFILIVIVVGGGGGFSSASNNSFGWSGVDDQIQ